MSSEDEFTRRARRALGHPDAEGKLELILAIRQEARDLDNVIAARLSMSSSRQTIAFELNQHHDEVQRRIAEALTPEEYFALFDTEPGLVCDLVDPQVIAAEFAATAPNDLRLLIADRLRSLLGVVVDILGAASFSTAGGRAGGSNITVAVQFGVAETITCEFAADHFEIQPEIARASVTVLLLRARDLKPYTVYSLDGMQAMQMIPVGNAPRQYRMAEFVEPSQLVVAVAHLEASQVDDLR